jgi:hypothetical protein
VILAIVAITIGALLLSRIDYVPIWDGFVYASAIDQAAANPTASALTLAGHVSHSYAGLAIAAQMLAPGHYWPLLLTNTILLLVAGVAFHRLARLVFPGRELETDRALLTAAFVLQPAILANVVQPGLDLPLVPWSLWTTVFLLERRWAWVAFGGVVLAFTKETGVLIYGVLIAAWIVTHAGLALGIQGSRRAAFVRLVALSVPGVAFGAYLLLRTQTAPNGEAIAWGVTTPTSAWQTLQQFSVIRIDRRLVSYLVVMLVMNFAWVMTVSIGVASVSAVARIVGRETSIRASVLSSSPSIRMVAVLTIGLGYALTRFSTFTNPRYLTAVTPFLLLLFFGALQYVAMTARARTLVLAAFVSAVALSTTRTIDPVSRGAFGTFSVGERRMLWMTSMTGECCGYGRDQLAYNLEFTSLSRAADDALALMQPGDSTLIVVPDWTNWLVLQLIEPRTGRRTIDWSAGIVPMTTETDSAQFYFGQRPAAVYLDLPNGQPEGRLSRLSPRYVASGERRVNRDGYVVSAYRLSFRAKRAQSAGEVEKSPSSR